MRWLETNHLPQALDLLFGVVEHRCQIPPCGDIIRFLTHQVAEDAPRFALLPISQRL
jgi:hypothetical protein